MEAHMAVSKIGKYATSISGDTLELIERPNGGLSIILADGQWSGKSAKAISNVVTRKAVSLLADGVRDGAAARAASDYLYTYRSGKVQATLNILSIDLQSQTLVITRNNPAPVILVRKGRLIYLDQSAQPVGTRLGIRPEINEIPLESGLVVIAFTDGLLYAGDRAGQKIDITQCVNDLIQEGTPTPSRWADYLLEQAIALDQGRPADDISIVVIATLPRTGDSARRLTACMPLG
jgi:serine phosphatase RsbU (regulator of sigma subunit)